MSIALIYPQGNAQAWVRHLKECDPALEIQVWPEINYEKPCEMVVAWYQPEGELSRVKGLRCIASLGAGVEHILFDPTLPPNIPITRIIDDGLAREMTEYVTMMVLVQKRQLLQQQHYQRERRWVKDADEKRDRLIRVGILGLGTLGCRAAAALSHLGFPVNGWSLSKKDITGVQSFVGNDQLEDFLRASEILVCMLPLTPSTENILCKSLFDKLPKGAYLINVGRGRHLVEEDLFNAIDSGHMAGACLDVFRNEPLPPESPFWSQPKITVTCHVSSITNPKHAAQQIVENHRRLLRNEPLLNTICPEKGY